MRLLTVAAVIGPEFELALLELVSDLEGEDFAAALDEAVAAALLTRRPRATRSHSRSRTRCCAAPC